MNEAELVAEAVAHGYPDVTERCATCGAVFRNYHHWIRCELGDCPMKSKDKRPLLDYLDEQTPQAET